MEIETTTTSSARSGPRRRPWTTVRAAVAALLVCLAGTAVRQPAVAAPEAGLRLVGELPVGQGTPVLSDPARGRLLVLAEGAVDAYDAVTLAREAHLPLDPYRLQGHASGAPVVYAWTPGAARLYLLVYAASDFGKLSPYLATIDPAGPTIESAKPVTFFSHGLVAQGMSYYPAANVLYVLGADPSSGIVGAHTMQLVEADAATGTTRWPRPHPLGAVCQKSVSTNAQAAVHRAAGTTKVYFGCGTGNLVFSREPGLPGVVAVDVADPAHITARAIPISGSYANGDSIYDAAANRLMLMSAGTGVPAQAVWIFDEVREVVVGVVAAGNLNLQGMGVDPVGGRLFAAIDEHLLIGTDRGLRIPQATQIPLAGVQAAPIAVIQFAHRLVASVQTADTIVHTLVYEYPHGDYVEPPTSDPDASTIDEPESDRTGATFGADAKAYGARVKQVAGVNGIGQNVAATGTDYWAASGGRVGVNDGDREMWFARVTRARLGQAEASATSVTTDADANTKADYTRDYSKQDLPAQPEDSPEPPSVDGGRKWPYEAAACADFGSSPKTADAPQATASCKAANSVSVTAAHEGGSAPNGPDGTPLATFDSSSSTSTLTRDAKAGTVVDTTAEARNVLIAGVARFGRIASHAVSGAHGRPHTTAAVYTTTFENVSMPGFACTTDCDPVAVVNALNAVLPATVVAELPGYELIRTPRGARGAALRDPWQHQQDVVLNNFQETELEVPALRVTYYGDNAVRSRLLVEFAATQANANYAIYRLPGIDDGPGGFGLEDVFSSGPIVESPPTVCLCAAPPAPPGGDSPRVVGGGGLFRRLGHGLRVLLTGRRALLLNALLWSLLALPAFLIGRRRYLLRVIGDS